MRKGSFGQYLAIFLVVIGVFYFIGAISDASEPKCIKAGCDNKQASGSSYCYLHKPYTSKSSSHSSSSYTGNSKSSNTTSSRSQVVQAAVVIVINQTLLIIHHIVAVLKRVIAQRKAVTILMMMDMTTYIWMEIMTMITMIEIVIMQMVWTMRWMNSTRIGRLEVKFYG